MSLYRNKYRSETTRLQSWDYGSNAAYFVTICTHDRLCHFGHVIDNQMQLSEIGMIADRCWLEIPDHFPFVKLGNHIVMPNHVHGIVVIDRRDAINRVPTINIDPGRGGITGNKNPMLRENLPRIIRWYKGRITFESRKINPDFKWQSRYHDHIIRNARAYQRISEYITNNPIKWQDDKLRLE